MNTCSFFDCINSPSSILNKAEDYLYLPLISKFCGFRKFEMIQTQKGNHITLKLKSEKNSFFQSKCVRIAEIIKLISYATLILPAIACLCKVYHRKLYQFQIEKPKQVDEDIVKTFEKIKPQDVKNSQSANKITNEALILERESAELEIKQLWDEYKKNHEQMNTNILVHSLPIIQLDIEDKGPTSCIDPDRGMGNIFLDFEKNPDVFFVPAPAYDISKSNNKDLTFLKKCLSLGFKAGKKLVIIRFANSTHCFLGAFSDTGDYKIIDSMFSKTLINVKNLSQDLNEALIKNAHGITIKFQGKGIHPHLQKQGHECIRFANLYGYQIAKKLDLNAYSEVNQAFASGKMNFFTDYKNIDEKNGLEDASQVSRNNYDNFMESWCYFSHNIPVAKWQDIPLSAVKFSANHVEECLSPSMSMTKQQYHIYSIVEGGKRVITDLRYLTKGKKEEWVLSSKNDKEQEEILHLDAFIDLSQDIHDGLTLGGLSTQYPEKIVILIAGKNKTFLYPLPADKILFFRPNPEVKDKKIKIFID